MTDDGGSCCSAGRIERGTSAPLEQYSIGKTHTPELSLVGHAAFQHPTCAPDVTAQHATMGRRAVESSSENGLTTRRVVTWHVPSS